MKEDLVKLIIGLVIAAVIIGISYLNFCVFKILHPGAPWWGFFLHG